MPFLLFSLLAWLRFLRNEEERRLFGASGFLKRDIGLLIIFQYRNQRATNCYA